MISPVERDPSRRDMLFLATGAFGAVGAATAVWPFISQMSPDASTRALGASEIDIASVPVGAIITVKWRGKPVFVRHRTTDEIRAARNVALAELSDPQSDDARIQRPEWLVVVGVCPHLGCVPLGEPGRRGAYDGWFCPCHGSQFDTSGRVRRGPAPTNLAVPPYAFVTATRIRIG